jgi:hypothetical protein
MATQQRTENRSGMIPGAAYFALELVERTQLTAIGLMQDTRAEVRVAVDAAIDLADKSLSSVFRIARKLTQRVDDAMAETLNGAERWITSSMQNARETTRSAVDVANKAISGTGTPPVASA